MPGGIPHPPERLNNRHKYAALLIAMGMKKSFVAKKLGMHPNRLSIIQRSPLFRTLVEQYQRDFIARGMQTTIDKVMADGPANVDFIRGIRDGTQPDIRNVEEANDVVRHKLSAAGMLLDRQLPRRQESDTGTKVQIVVEARHRAAAEDACSEVGEPIDVTPVPVGQKRLAPPIQKVVPRELDDVIREYMDRELASGE